MPEPSRAFLFGSWVQDSHWGRNNRKTTSGKEPASRRQRPEMDLKGVRWFGQAEVMGRGSGEAWGHGGVSEWPTPAGGGGRHVGEGGEPIWIRIVKVMKSSLIFLECYCQPGAALSTCQGLTHQSTLSRRWAGRVWRMWAPCLAPAVGSPSHCCLIRTPEPAENDSGFPQAQKPPKEKHSSTVTSHPQDGPHFLK